MTAAGTSLPPRCLRPAWITLLLVTGLQHVVAKFAFIKREAGTRDLNNRSATCFFVVFKGAFEVSTRRTHPVCREGLFLLTYLLFLINTVVGLVVAIWRMVITALYNIFHLGRVDISLLHRSSETYDPGTGRAASCSRRQT